MEIVSQVKSREGSRFLHKAASTGVVVMDAAGGHQVRDGVVRDCLPGGGAVVAADRDVNDDVGGVVYDLKALLHSRCEIDVPNSATIHEDVTIQELRREHHRD